MTSAFTLSVKATNTAKPRVVDFHTWLEAWNNFIQASIFYHPELTSQLLTYQANICQFAGKYNIADVLNYDVLVRRDLANNHSLRWDAIYDLHFEANLKGKTQAQCFYCHRYGYMASACPIKPQGTKKGRMVAKETSTQSSGTFRLPRPERFCAIFNRGEVCKLECAKTVSQPSVLSPEALVVNVLLIASTSTQSVHTSLCSVIPTVSFSSSPSSQCYGEGIFGGVFTPIPKSATTPVNVEVLRFELAGYPDLTMKDYLLNGFTHGFDIGYKGPRRAVQCQNQLSASANPEHITEAIKKELLRGHTAGPFLSPPFKDLHCSSLGAVPKKDGSYRLIMDLSSPWATRSMILSQKMNIP